MKKCPCQPCRSRCSAMRNAVTPPSSKVRITGGRSPVVRAFSTSRTSAPTPARPARAWTCSTKSFSPSLYDAADAPGKPLASGASPTMRSWYSSVTRRTLDSLRGALPAQILAEPRLAPLARAPAGNRDWSDGTVRNRAQALCDRRQILEHDAMLNHDVRLGSLVERIAEVAEDRPRVHAAIDLEQRQPHAREVTVRERPETAVRVSVLRTDAGMKHERPSGWNREHARPDDLLAEGEHHVWPVLPNERLDLGRVGAARPDHRDGRRHGRVARLHLGERPIEPLRITTRQRCLVIRSKCEHIEHPKRAHAAGLTLEPPPAQRP